LPARADRQGAVARSRKALSPGVGDTAERRLLDDAIALGHSPAGRHGVHIELSQLRPHNRREKHIRIVENCLDVLLASFPGRVYCLGNVDIVFFCRDASFAAIRETLDAIEYLFIDDPFFLQREPGASTISRIYPLETAHAEFLALAEQLHAAEARRAERLSAVEASDAAVKQPLDPFQLAKVVAAISRADLSNLVRCQTVCFIGKGAAPEPRLQELYVSVSDLGALMLPGHDFGAEPWLFRYMTRLLDRRLLAILPSVLGAAPRPSSINLNLATLFSPEFLRFDAEMRVGMRDCLTLELQLLDVLAHGADFAFGEKVAHQRGYRICLDGVDHHHLPLLLPRLLPVDFVKVQWHREIEQSTDAVAEFRAFVGATNARRVILTRCDSEAAIEFGRTVGIQLFQGWHVEKLLSGGAHLRRPPPRQRRRPAA
jgi:hypothetical protein